MSGRYKGYTVEVYTFTKGSGKNSSTWTRFHVNFRKSLGLGLQLKRQGFFSGIAKVFGAQDIEIGDAGFDKAIVVKGARPERVREFMTQARSHADSSIVHELQRCPDR